MQIVRYQRDKAVAYAHKWAVGRNPSYLDFSDIGGDCTNFASQCVYAGAGVMNTTPTFGWYYRNVDNRAPSWTGVEYFHNFMIGNENGAGPFMEQVSLAEIMPGDVVQIKFAGMEHFSHCPVVVAVGTPAHIDNILVAAHTYDSDNRPLSTYEFAQLRPLHVLGVRKQ